MGLDTLLENARASAAATKHLAECLQERCVHAFSVACHH